MQSPDWDSVLQYVSEPLEMDFCSPERGNRSRIGNYPSAPQIPTPPQSHDGSPVMDDGSRGDALVSVSTTFYPGANINPLPADLVLRSSDSVLFYVHSHVLLSASENSFNSMLPGPPAENEDHLGPVLSVREPSVIFNIVLHTIYDLSCTHYAPSSDDMISAVHALKSYGIPLKRRIVPSSPLFNALASHAPLRPFEIYALASYYDLYDLAVLTSPHLLSFPLSSLSDDMADRVGAVYLKRLFFLHFGRIDALKRILLPPPHPHTPTPWCDFTEQKKLTRAWALASAYLAWDARPDISTSTMESALSPLGVHLSCDLCRQSLKERIETLVVQWSAVKRTI